MMAIPLALVNNFGVGAGVLGLLNHTSIIPQFAFILQIRQVNDLCIFFGIVIIVIIVVISLRLVGSILLLCRGRGEVLGNLVAWGALKPRSYLL